MRISPEYLLKVEKELAELKSLVGQFLDTIIYVQLDDADCDKDKADELWQKLVEAIEDKQNDRK
jgi:predicted AAA+ superfamily ATPase